MLFSVSVALKVELISLKLVTCVCISSTSLEVYLVVLQLFIQYAIVVPTL